MEYSESVGMWKCDEMMLTTDTDVPAGNLI